MTKQNIIDIVSDATGLTKVETEAAKKTDKEKKEKKGKHLRHH